MCVCARTTLSWTKPHTGLPWVLSSSWKAVAALIYRRNVYSNGYVSGYVSRGKKGKKPLNPSTRFDPLFSILLSFSLLFFFPAFRKQTKRLDRVNFPVFSWRRIIIASGAEHTYQLCDFFFFFHFILSWFYWKFFSLSISLSMFLLKAVTFKDCFIGQQM